MQSERDYLQKYVFPELEDKLAKRFHHLEPIDLRWGVETLSVSDQMQKEKLVLTVCLNEIERSVPFIIILVGDRYGWIPPKENIDSALNITLSEGEKNLKSVTAIEIEYGVLENATSQEKSFFYFRKPLPYSEMPKDIVEIYKDDENNDSHNKLESLKKRIIEVMPKNHIRYYEGKWDKKRNMVIGLERWGEQVSADLWKVLSEETKDFEQPNSSTWQTEEYLALQEFIELRSQSYVGKSDLLSTIDHAISIVGAPNIHFISGADGSGKSSLFSKLIMLKEESEQTIHILAHSCGISPKSKSIEDMLKRWIRELSQKQGLSDPSSFIKSYSELRETFHMLVNIVAKEVNILICVDGLDRFKHSTLAQQLGWLPVQMPINVHFFATINDSTTIQIDKRSYNIFKLDLLTEHEAKLMIEEILKKYRKKLNPQIIEAILKKQVDSEAGKVVYKPLWIKLVVDELLILDSKDFKLLRMFEGTDEQKLHNLLLSTVAEVDSEIIGLYLRLFERVEDAFGYEWTKNIVSLISLSNSGLRSKDLKHIVGSSETLDWSDLHFAGFRNYLRSHLKQTGMLNQWNFIHHQAVPAIQKRYLKNEEEVKSFRYSIARYTWNLDKKDIFRQTELGFYLLKVKDYSKFAMIYSSSEITDEEQKRLTLALKEEISFSGIEFIAKVFAITNLKLEKIGIAKRLMRLLVPQVTSEFIRSALLVIIFNELKKILHLKEDEINHELYLVFAEVCLLLSKHLLEEKKLDKAENVLIVCLPDLSKITSKIHNEAKNSYLLAVYSQIIVIKELQGDLDQTREWKNKKASIEDWFLKESSTNPRYIKEKLVEYRRIILMAFQDGKLEEIEEVITSLLDLSKSSHLRAPEVSDFAKEYAISLVFQGDYEWRKQTKLLAKESYEKAEDILNRFLIRWSDNKDLINTQAMIEQRLGDYYYAIEKIEQSKKYFEKVALKLSTLLKENPKSINLQRDLSIVNERLSCCLFKNGQVKEAIEMLKLEIIKKELISQDYGGLLFEIATSHEQVGDFFIEYNSITEAIASYQKAAAYLKKLNVVKKSQKLVLVRIELKLELITSYNFDRFSK